MLELELESLPLILKKGTQPSHIHRHYLTQHL